MSNGRREMQMNERISFFVFSILEWMLGMLWLNPNKNQTRFKLYQWNLVQTMYYAHSHASHSNFGFIFIDWNVELKVLSIFSLEEEKSCVFFILLYFLWVKCGNETAQKNVICVKKKQNKTKRAQNKK